jgi:hypothetical protein
VFHRATIGGEARVSRILTTVPAMQPAFKASLASADTQE